MKISETIINKIKINKNSLSIPNLSTIKIYRDWQNTRWIREKSILPEIKELYSRLDKIMATNEHKTSSAFNRVELSKLKQTVIDIQKELQRGTKE